MGALSTRRFCENKTRKYGRVCAAALLISTANTNTAHDRWERHAGVTTWTACVEWQCHRPETRDAVGRLLLWVRAGGEGGGGCGGVVRREPGRPAARRDEPRASRTLPSCGLSAFRARHSLQ